MGLRRAVVSASVLILLSATAHARPNRVAEPDQYIRVGSQSGPCATQVLDANTTTFPMSFPSYYSTGAGSGPRPICYGWGDIVTVTASDEATFCWTLTTSVSIGSQSTRVRGYIDDSVSIYDGPGACFTLGGAGSWSGWPDYYALRGTATSTTVGGYRANICSGPQRPSFPTSPDRKTPDRRVPFCRVDGDCTEAGVSGGTCSAIDTDAEIRTAAEAGCAFLVAKALNASTEVSACPER